MDDPLELLDAVVAGFGGERREGQRALARAVADAMRDAHHLVAEAPTGSGKSLAYLAPAVASGSKVVVATSTKALQSQLVEKDLPALRDFGGVDFSYALLKGRSNYICRAKLRTAARPDSSAATSRIESMQRKTEAALWVGRIATLIGLGLNKRHRSRELVDTPEVRGMINKVRHLVRVEDDKAA